MTLTVTLPETTVDVVPGSSTVLAVHLTNSGADAVRCTVAVGGRASTWIRVVDGTPSSLAPGATATLSLLVAPPAGSATSGQLVPFAVLAVSDDGGRASGRATGLVLVGSRVPVTASIVPATAQAAGLTRHVLELTTEEPTGVLVTLSGVPGTSGATVTVDPVAVRVDPTRPAQAAVTVRPRRPAVLGTRPHPFEVVWETEGPDGLARGSVAGRLEQRPHLPPALTGVLALVLLGGVVVGLLALWPPAGEAPTTTAAPSGPPASSGGPAQRGPVAVLHAQLMDRDPGVSRAVAEEVASSVTVTDGLRAQVVDSATVPPGSTGFWLVVVSGFGDTAEAEAFCRSRPPSTPCRMAG